MRKVTYKVYYKTCKQMAKEFGTTPTEINKSVCDQLYMPFQCECVYDSKTDPGYFMRRFYKLIGYSVSEVDEFIINHNGFIEFKEEL